MVNNRLYNILNFKKGLIIIQKYAEIRLNMIEVN